MKLTKHTCSNRENMVIVIKHHSPKS